MFSFLAPVEGAKVRERSVTFSDHYSQARQFFMSQTEPEQDHIVAALIVELSKVETPIVRAAMLGHLVKIEESLGNRVANGLGHDAPIVPARAAVATRTDVKPSPKLSILANGLPTMVGRLVGILVTDGASSELMDSLIEAVKAAEASVKIVAPKLDGVTLDNGSKLKGDFLLVGGPSVLFDTVAIVASEAGVDTLLGEAAAVAWVHDAFLHLKVIAHSPEVADLLDVASVEADEGIVALVSNDATAYLDIAGRGPM